MAEEHPRTHYHPHTEVHIRSIPNEALKTTFVGAGVGLVAAICQGYFESRIVVDPRQLPSSQAAAKRLFTYPVFFGVLGGAYVTTQALCNAVRGVHERDWITSFSSGVMGGAALGFVKKYPVFRTAGLATAVGLIVAFFEGPFQAGTQHIQKYALQNQVQREPLERYKALGAKANEVNSIHLANLERQALQVMEESRS